MRSVTLLTCAMIVVLSGVLGHSGGQTGSPQKKEDDYKSPKLAGEPVAKPKRDKGKEEESVPPPPEPKKAKEKEKKEEPATVVDEKSVMPLTFVRNKIENLKVGDYAFIPATTVKVDFSRKCWLDPSTVYTSQLADKFVQVRREEDGYHLTIPDKLEHQWVAADLPQQKVIWLEVKTINVSTK